MLVHGAGSFGHQIVSRTRIDRGLSGPESLRAMGETQRLQYVLCSRVAHALLEAGLPVMPVQASALAVMRSGQLEQMELTVVEELLRNGLVPLLYGVPAVDRVRGCAILSGDAIAPYVASRLGIPRLVHATNVDGVFDADPTVFPDARPIRRIDRRNWDQVRTSLTGSAEVDVTGGMAAKVGALLELARSGTVSCIVSARIPGRVAAALTGADVGTVVGWEEA